VNKSLLIFRHEFLSTIKRAGFIIMTLALPVLALLAIGVTQLISGIVKPSGPAQITNIGYVDQTGGFSQFNSQGTVELKPYNTPDTALRALVQKDVKEYFVIPADYATNGMVTIYTLEKQLTAPQEVQTAIKNFLSSNLMVNKIPGATINVIESPLYLNTVRVTDTGEVAKDQGGLSNLIIPLIFGVLLAMSLSFSSSYLLQGLGEEKENRLMEILLSSVSTRQLVTGKVLGIGVAGLIQVVVWVISLPLLLHLASASIGGFISTIHIQANFLAAGIVYFILGYLLFAVLALCIASISPTAREGQGMAAIFTMFSVAPFWFLSLLMLFPNSSVWIVFSIFPFSAPVLVMLRLGLYGIPVWQLAASMAVMVLSIIAGLLLAAKLLRIYLLMYGKRPTIPEIVRSIGKS
jgi:ABC-2 type transport system permease protein